MLARALPSYRVVAGLAFLAACAAGCASTGPRRAEHGQPKVTVGATVAIGTSGALELATPCVVSTLYFYDARVERATTACPPGPIKGLPGDVVVTTPWGATAHRPVSPGITAVPIEWDAAPFDPLAAGIRERLGGAWHIDVPGERSPREWYPSEADIARMIAVLAELTDTQTEVVRGGPPPALVVAELRADPELRAGATARLVLAIENQGKGAAYRVVVTTRSSVDSLHGLRFAFGSIAPGARKTRDVEVSIDQQTTDPSAMIVLAFAEGNDAGPAKHSQRLAIQPPAREPRLALACGARDRMDAIELAVDAAVPLKLICVVKNSGGPARGVTLEVTLGDGEAKVFGPLDLETSASHTFDVRLELPRDAMLDAELPLRATIREREFGRSASDSLTIVIDRAAVCPSGKLSRKAYQAKRAELVKARDAGGLTDAEFDAYDAELVGCLE